MIAYIRNCLFHSSPLCIKKYRTTYRVGLGDIQYAKKMVFITKIVLIGVHMAKLAEKPDKGVKDNEAYFNG